MTFTHLLHSPNLASPSSSSLTFTRLLIYTPGSGEHGPRFLTGGPGAAPGGVASKNGWVYMRVRGESISYSPGCLLSLNDSWSVENWVARKVARLPRRVEESTPRPKGRWVCEARRHALPACGSDPTPSTFQRLTLPVGFENGREREREGGAGAPRRTGRMNREGEVCSLVTCGVHFGARRRARARRRCVPRQLRLSTRSSECCGTREEEEINHW